MAQPDNFIRVLRGIYHVCQKAADSLQRCVSSWHLSQTQTNHLNCCTQPSICSKVRRKPKNSTSCTECTEWVQPIEDVFYPQPTPPQKPNIVWTNIDSSLLYSSAIEVCNGFALKLPPGKTRPTQIVEYDPASILKIMLGFSEYHNNNTATLNFKDPHTTIQKVRDSIHNHRLITGYFCLA